MLEPQTTQVMIALKRHCDGTNIQKHKQQTS